jgi:CubicO group peptidase (beta-lactamase class C family)
VLDWSYNTVTRFDWGTDAAGLHTACCLLRLRPADMIKIGEVYLGRGSWHGKQILPPGWVEQTMAPNDLSSQYGLMWWIDIDSHGHPAWFAKGSLGQLIAVVPEHQLVVVVGTVPTKDHFGDPDASFLLNEVIAPAFA